MAVAAEQDRLGRLGPGQPRLPLPAVGRHLHVVVADRVHVLGGPGDREALVALARGQDVDAGLRRGRVVEELGDDRPVQLGTGPVVAQRPDARATQAGAVDHVVLGAEALGVVVVDLAPGRRAAGARAAVAPLVGDPGRPVAAVVTAAVLLGQGDRSVVGHRGRPPVLRTGVGRGPGLVGHGRPGPSVVRETQDELAGRDAVGERQHGVDQVVGRAAQRRDRAGRSRRGGPVVVTHDEDGVGGTRRGGGLDRVVADRAGRVERQLVPPGDPVQLRPDGPDEVDELVGAARHERLEVEVHSVGTPVPDGRRDLAGELEPGRGVAQEGRLVGRLVGRPAERLDGQHDPRAATVGGLDDRGHPRAGPAGPADRGRAVAVALEQVAIGVRAHAEVGDRREEPVIEPGRTIAELPVGQEPEHLATQVGGANGLGRLIGGDQRRNRFRSDRRPRCRPVDRTGSPRQGLRVARLGSAGGRRPDRALAAGGHRPAGCGAGRQRPWSEAVDRPTVVRARAEREADRATRRKRDPVVLVGGRVEGDDRRLPAD